MKFEDLVAVAADLPCFSTQYLAAGESLHQVRLQLSRWAASGKVIRLSKGLYTLAEPYLKIKPHPFAIANRLNMPSYISLQSALAWYGMIPEYTPVTTSVTTSRPKLLNTPLGYFQFRHIAKKYFWGYQRVSLLQNQQVFIARPEKAVIDLLHLTPQGNNPDYLRTLRLQNLGKLDLDYLRQAIERLSRPKFKHLLGFIELLGKESYTEIV